MYTILKKKYEKCRFSWHLWSNVCYLTYPYSPLMYINSRPLDFQLSIHKVSDLVNMVSQAMWQTDSYINSERPELSLREI